MQPIGQSVIDHVFDSMSIDAEWSVRKPGEFTWWAGPLAQRVWCDPPVDDNGMAIHRVHARTDVVVGFEGSEKQLQLLGLQARMSTLSALARDNRNRTTIQLACNVNAHEETKQWLADVMSLACATQVTEAHLLVPLLTDVVDSGLRIAASEHPGSGPREELDDMLNIIELAIRPEGNKPSAWVGPDMERLLELFQSPPCVLATGDDSGLTAEFPFGDQTSLLRVMTSEANPRMGNGCLVTLTLPLSDDELAASRWLSFNELEEARFAPTHLLGSWCPHEHGPTFVSFLPNALYRPGALTNLVMSVCMRARWVTWEVFQFDFDGGVAEAAARKKSAMEAFVSAIKSLKK